METRNQAVEDNEFETEDLKLLKGSIQRPPRLFYYPPDL